MSRLPNAPSSNVPINEHFPNEQFFAMIRESWFADIVNFLVTRKTPEEWSRQYKCVYLYMYVCGCTCMGLCAHVGVKCIFIFICMYWLCVTVFRTRSVRSEPSYRRPGADPDSYSLWTRCIGNLKTAQWDDP